MTKFNGSYKELRALLGPGIRTAAGRYLAGAIEKEPELYRGLLKQFGSDHFLIQDIRGMLATQLAEEKDLREKSIYDGLTRMHSRAYFDARLPEEFTEAVRTGNPLALTLFDVDNFKTINDGYGHMAGDAVLRTVAKAVNASSRRSDVTARYGGEEIARLMPRTDIEGAEKVSESIRERVGNAITNVDGHRISVTISGGVSVYPIGDIISTADGLVATADHALYNAKRGGRNRIASVKDMRPETIRGIVGTIRKGS